MIPVRDPMQETASFEPTRARDTFRRFHDQHSRGHGPGQPRTAHKCVQMRAGALRIGPPAPHGQHSNVRRRNGANGRERARMGTRTGTLDRTHKPSTSGCSSDTDAAKRSAGAAMVTTQMTPAMMVVTAATMGGVFPAHCERTHMSVHACAPKAPTRRCVHMWAGGRGRTITRVVALAAQEGPRAQR